MTLVYLIIFLLNIISIIVSVEQFENIMPFVLVFSTFLVTSILLLLLQYIKTLNSDTFTAYAEKIINNGQQIIYITGLGIFDLIFFILIAPDLITQLEVEFNIPIIFYALFYFLVPVILFRLFVDPVGAKFESLFWIEFHDRIITGSSSPEMKIIPSSSFSSFILNQILVRQQRMQGGSRKSNDLFQEGIQNQNYDQSYQMSDGSSQDNEDEIVVTSYPVPEESNIDKSVPETRIVFDRVSESTLEKKSPYAIVEEEILNWFPKLRPFIEKTPVGLRTQLFIDIIVIQALKNPEIYQFFKTHAI